MTILSDEEREILKGAAQRGGARFKTWLASALNGPETVPGPDAPGPTSEPPTRTPSPYAQAFQAVYTELIEAGVPVAEASKAAREAGQLALQKGQIDKASAELALQMGSPPAPSSSSPTLIPKPEPEPLSPAPAPVEPYPEPPWHELLGKNQEIGPWRVSDEPIAGWQVDVHKYYTLRGWRRYVHREDMLIGGKKSSQKQRTVDTFYWTNDPNKVETPPYNDQAKYMQSPITVTKLAFPSGIDCGYVHVLAHTKQLRKRAVEEADERRAKYRQVYEALPEDEVRRRLSDDMEDAVHEEVLTRPFE